MVFFFSHCSVNDSGQWRQSTVNGGGQCWRGTDALGLTSLGLRQRDVTRADVARQWERTRACGVWECVAALVGAWKCVRAWLESQKLLTACEGACEAESGRFWWQWTDLDEIYPMELSMCWTTSRRWGFRGRQKRWEGLRCRGRDCEPKSTQTTN